MRPFLIPALAVLLAFSSPLHAQAPAAPRGTKPDFAATAPPNPLPPPVTTSHALSVGGRTLHFRATAGAVRLSNGKTGEPVADVGYVAYQLDGADPRTRPLSVALNGGPGASSAWLDLGALGPWRLPLQSSDLAPSGATGVVDNADTWLDFTDLLFIDPPGTGYSRSLAKGEDAEKKQFTSVEGDIDVLATVVRKWLLANDRLAGPEVHRRRELRRLSRPQARAPARVEGGRRGHRPRHDLAGARFQLVPEQGQPRRVCHPAAVPRRGGARVYRPGRARQAPARGSLRLGHLPR